MFKNVIIIVVETCKNKEFKPELTAVFKRYISLVYYRHIDIFAQQE